MKKCFKCNEVKELLEFYPHKMMADGRLNKCKDCAKKDSDENYKRKMLDPDFEIKERERSRMKSRKRVAEGKQMIYARKKPIKLKAHSLVKSALTSGAIKKLPCQVCGKEKSEGHHEDYDKPIDVVWLCSRHHADRHIHLRNAKTLGQEPMPINYFIKSLQVTA